MMRLDMSVYQVNDMSEYIKRVHPLIFKNEDLSLFHKLPPSFLSQLVAFLTSDTRMMPQDGNNNSAWVQWGAPLDDSRQRVCLT